MFDDGSNGIPPLERSSPADEYMQHQVRGWSYLPLAFGILIPWMWIYFAFSYDLRKDLPLLAAVVMHAGLALVWYGRRVSRRGLTWAGIGCYPLAAALCLLLQDVL
ncbi:hypothetical protein IPZ61_28275 [Streptomyces sioyaensis]|uniref:hypothetical protein n=1 Tax=Streptomyces sioyaensis TaxID=67364 RepID=UPI001F487F9D|nr:hypothetical protein [Streptomyces sioyaensis]MCF3177200.1 hypothetical protein [Streptomyces sioyaensis]